MTFTSIAGPTAQLQLISHQRRLSIFHSSCLKPAFYQVIMAFILEVSGSCVGLVLSTFLILPLQMCPTFFPHFFFSSVTFIPQLLIGHLLHARHYELCLVNRADSPCSPGGGAALPPATAGAHALSPALKGLDPRHSTYFHLWLH